jgi:hypothetical protein
MSSPTIAFAVLVTCISCISCIEKDPGTGTPSDAGGGSTPDTGTVNTGGRGQNVAPARDVKCPNNASCKGNQACCTSPTERWASHNCTDTCGEFWQLDCDGRSDCDPGMICCGLQNPANKDDGVIAGSRCKVACAPGERQLCQGTDECASCGTSPIPPNFVNVCN